MTRRKLLIASPAKGGIPAHYLVLHNQVIRQNGIGEWSVEYLVEGANNALNISRNICANDAITNGFDRVLFLDTDMPARIDQLARILSHDHEKYPIVSGMYCLKKPGTPFWLGIVKPDSKPDENFLQEAAFLPTGCLSVSVDALKKMQAAHPDREVYVQSNVLLPPGPVPTETTMWDLFPIGPQGTRTPQARLKRIRKAMATVMEKGATKVTRPDMLAALQGVAEALTYTGEPGFLCGEDYAFSLLAQQAGIPLYIDTNCVIDHRGTIDFPITDPAVVATTSLPLPQLRGHPEEW